MRDRVGSIPVFLVHNIPLTSTNIPTIRLKKNSYLVTPTIITYGSFQPSHSCHVSGVRQSSRVFARAFAFVLVATVATAAAVEVATLILNSSRCINPELMTKSILLLLSLWRWWWVERIMGWRGDGRFALYRCKRRGWYERVDREEVPGRRRKAQWIENEEEKNVMDINEWWPVRRRWRELLV